MDLLQQIKNGRTIIENLDTEETRKLKELYDEGYITYRESWQKKEDGEPVYYYEVKAI